MRRTHRSDANQDDIVKRLRACGIHVFLAGRPVDLICGFQGKNWLLEVKNRDGLDKITPDQASFIATWPGQVDIVYTADEALAVILGKAVLA